MAAPLSLPDGCREKRSSMLGQRNGKSPSANAGAFAGGDFLYVFIKQAQKLSAR